MIVDIAPSPQARSDVAERFWSKVDFDGPDGCWLWTGATDRCGYGIFKIRPGPAVSAHQVAYALVVGYDDAGSLADGVPVDYRPDKPLELDHACHNRAVQAGLCPGGDGCIHRRCVNPGHLWPVTHAQNQAAARPVRCRRGHPLNRANTRRRRNGSRLCRACEQLRQRRYRRGAT